MNNKEIKPIGTQILKRIHAEIAELLSKYKTLDVHYTEEIIQIKIENKEFHINHNYPFLPPQVYIHSLPYHHFLNTINPKIIKTMKKYTDLTCFCCNTIICHANWTASYRIEKIMDEIANINHIKSRVKYDHAIKFLSDKVAIFLPPPIYNIILEYL
jgi:ubiquitin-protein ligase